MIRFGTGGWRAVIGEDFTRENVRRVAAGILAVNGLVIVEARIGKTLDGLEETGFVITREKEYKNNKHVFMRLCSED